MPNLTVMWNSIAKDKLKWAYEANEKFLAKISHQDIKDYISKDKEKKLAVMYGKSQVGKTTLILALMGAKEDMLARIEKILRAGRDKGRSSTATAMRQQF